MKQKHTTEKVFSIPELIERGWTKPMIKKLMPEHDDERDNPHYKCAAPMKLYKKRRVYGYERGNKWKELKKASVANIARGKKAAETKSLNLEIRKNAEIEMLNNADLYVPANLSMKQVREDAIQHYNTRCRNSDHFASSFDSKNFLNRITVNYIVHQLSGTKETCQFPTLKAEGHKIINDRLRDKIIKIYPQLDYEKRSN